MEKVLEVVLIKNQSGGVSTPLPVELLKTAVRLRKTLELLNTAYYREAQGMYAKTVWAIRDVERKIFSSQGKTPFELAMERRS